MSPLKDHGCIKKEDWERISKQVPPRGKTRGSRELSEEEKLLQEAIGGQPMRLEYDTPTEANNRGSVLRTKGNGKVRVITDPNDFKSIFIGPVD